MLDLPSALTLIVCSTSSTPHSSPSPPSPSSPPLQMLLYLKEFSQKMVGKTHEIERQVDTLVGEARATDTRVNNVYNDFLMLSNIQFVESVSFFLLSPSASSSSLPLSPFCLFSSSSSCYLTNLSTPQHTIPAVILKLSVVLVATTMSTHNWQLFLTKN